MPTDFSCCQLNDISMSKKVRPKGSHAHILKCIRCWSHSFLKFSNPPSDSWDKTHHSSMDCSQYWLHQSTWCCHHAHAWRKSIQVESWCVHVHYAFNINRELGFWKCTHMHMNMYRTWEQKSHFDSVLIIGLTDKKNYPGIMINADNTDEQVKCMSRRVQIFFASCRYCWYRKEDKEAIIPKPMPVTGRHMQALPKIW